MFYQLAISIKLTAALRHRALKRLHIVVPIDMVLKISAGGEAHVAQVTSVRLLAGVRPLVHEQVRDAVEEAAADSWLQAFHRSFVGCVKE